MAPSSIRRIRFVDRLARPGWFVTTGALLGLSFPPFPFSFLALVALVPLLARWSRQPALGMLFRETYSAFLIFAALSGYWVLFHHETLKALMLGAALLALPALLAVPVVASRMIAQRFGMALGLTSLVAGWLALEFVLLHGPLPVPWLLLGHTQADAVLVNQFADLGGVGGLSLWIWLVNLLVFGLIQLRALTPRFAISLGLLVLMVLPVGYRAWRMTTLPPASDTVRVAIVQPSVPMNEWTEIASADRVQLLADLADQHLALLEPIHATPERPRIVIWPEAALPVFPEERLQQTLYDRLGHWSARRRVALLTGAVTRFDTAPALTVEPYRARQHAASRPYYNSALLFSGQNRPQQYDKIQMLPVADQVPLVGVEPGQRLGVSNVFGTGAHRTLFRAAGASFSTLISYEAHFGDHARQMVLDGAEFITVLANTGWWNYAPATRQYESMARLRAIETRRAIVLASVNGGSGVILPDGSVVESKDWMERGVVIASVPRQTHLSPYMRAGDVVYRVAGLATVLLGLLYGGALLFFPTTRRGARPVASPAGRAHAALRA